MEQTEAAPESEPELRSYGDQSGMLNLLTSCNCELVASHEREHVAVP
jgi:hypothetical protein